MRKRIFVLEDDRDLVDLLQYNLERGGFQVAFATEGTLALPSLRKFAPDLLILDLMLPGIDGMEVCRQIRQNPSYASLPILMLTARTEETDRVVGLEMGADDYVTKPFSMRELIARVRALLRRQESADMDRSVIQRGSIHIDKSAHKVRLGSRSVELSALEFRLLHLLASNPGIVFSRNQLLDRVWGTDRNVSPRSVDVYIRRLREKIEEQADYPVFIQTVHGVGYRFAEAS
jgi:two-component system phosphate regulon response regulator PhoB